MRKKASLKHPTGQRRSVDGRAASGLGNATRMGVLDVEQQIPVLFLFSLSFFALDSVPPLDWRMDGWLDGWLAGWTDGWSDEQGWPGTRLVDLTHGAWGLLKRNAGVMWAGSRREAVPSSAPTGDVCFFCAGNKACALPRRYGAAGRTVFGQG